MTSPAAQADELQDYARQCDDAIGASATVPDFDCDAGTEVLGQGSVFSGPNTGRSETCDEPNRLNKQCDPGSHFQVLTRTDDAYVVAHCRHEGGDDGYYGDIAVIQYNRKNGATCFYQALGEQLHGNMPGGHKAPHSPEKPVQAPLKGRPTTPNPLLTYFLTPSAAVFADHCGRCHDNGPIIRSPYLNQVKGMNALPGADDFSFNSDAVDSNGKPIWPYALVGQAFASWKAFKVEIAGNECNSCHRLGVNNVRDTGTALDFGIRATAASEVSKNPPTEAFPVWMPPHPPFPVQVPPLNPVHAAAAKAIHDCALRFHENQLPNSDSCRITQFAEAYVPPPPPPPPPPGAPIVTSVSPISNQCGDATSITIKGWNFDGATGVTAVLGFQDTPLLNISVTSNSITATVPNTLRAGVYEIVVRTPLGSSTQPFNSTRTDRFNVGPTVTGISPNQGPIPGGTEVTITGTCFDSTGLNQNSVNVFFGGSEAAKGFDQCASSTQCVVYSPAATNASQVDVVVSVDSAHSPTNSADLFTYTGPIISSLDPKHGPKTGGTEVLITGGPFPPSTGTGNFMPVAFGGAQPAPPFVSAAVCLRQLHALW